MIRNRKARALKRKMNTTQREAGFAEIRGEPNWHVLRARLSRDQRKHLDQARRASLAAR